MKITKFMVKVGVASLIGFSSVAYASHVVETPETYVFTADKGSTTIFNGSTITIDKDGFGGVASFSFDDPVLSSTPFTSGHVLADFVLGYGPLGWAGDIEVAVPLGGGGGITADEPSLSKSEFAFFPATGISLGETTIADPTALGYWTPEVASAPDTFSTFALLLGVVGIMAGAHHCNRPKALVRVRR
jgi:hypothetical protein